jgi:Bacterial regulatory proteins, tetR family.
MDDLIQAAIAQGLDHFSLSAIARSLGVAPPALYRLVQTREHLLYACLEKVAEEMPKPSLEASWQDAVTLWGDGLWDLCERYPGLDRILINCPDSLSSLRTTVRGFAETFSNGDSVNESLIEVLESIADTVLASHIAATTWRERRASGSERSLHLRDEALTRFGVEGDNACGDESSDPHRPRVTRKIRLLVNAVTRV